MANRLCAGTWASTWHEWDMQAFGMCYHCEYLKRKQATPIESVKVSQIPASTLWAEIYGLCN